MYRNKKIALFAYNFPHLKTQSFIVQMMNDGIIPDLILAADPVDLNVPPSTIKSKIRHQFMIDTSILAKTFNIPFQIVKHNSETCKQILIENHIDIAIISGARILKQSIIEAIPLGIINFHPGLIPEARGLDALFWSIYNNIDLGVTSHIIDSSIDAGKLLEIKKIKIYKDDTLFDLSERLIEQQYNMIKTSIDLAIDGKFIELDYSNTTYNTKMTAEYESRIKDLLQNYINHRIN